MMDVWCYLSLALKTFTLQKASAASTLGVGIMGEEGQATVSMYLFRTCIKIPFGPSDRK